MTESELVEKLKDKHWRMNHLYHIKDKRGKKVLFKYNQVQDEYQKNKHNRNIILKARQQGFTTFECINALDNCLFISFYDAGIIAHTVDDAEKIFTNKVKFAYDSLPEVIKKFKTPTNDRAGELRFPNGSSINVSSGYRGGTLMKLHVSEFGKICVKYPEKAREIVTGAFNAVPLDGDLTIESTAEGMDGAFYDLCMKAQNLRNDTLTPMDFKFQFFPWYKSKEYRLDPTGIDIPSAFESYFKTLKEDHGIELDEFQKAWYFKKSQEQDDDMGQEYPSFPEESFLQAGRPVFNNQKLAAQIKRAKDKPFEIKRFHLKSVDKELTVPVKVFRQPAKGVAYAVAGDPAEGLEDGDNSALSVLSKSFEQVATYAGKLDPDLFGKLMVEVGKYYNQALLAPETNNHGHAVIQSIKNEKYLRIFRREVKEELGRDITEKLGWQNNVKTKMEMLDELKQCFREDILEINDEATLREMMTVVIEEDGNIIVNGKDRVVALGISIQAIKQAGLEGEFKAFKPGQARTKDVTKMTMDEKLKHYSRMKSE